MQGTNFGKINNESIAPMFKELTSQKATNEYLLVQLLAKVVQNIEEHYISQEVISEEVDYFGPVISIELVDTDLCPKKPIIKLTKNPISSIDEDAMSIKKGLQDAQKFQNLESNLQYKGSQER